MFNLPTTVQVDTSPIIGSVGMILETSYQDLSATQSVKVADETQSFGLWRQKIVQYHTTGDGIGRFMSNYPVDALGHIQRGNSILHGFNRYTYANNNPYKYVDPDGKAPKGRGGAGSDLGGLILDVILGEDHRDSKNRLALAKAKQGSSGGKRDEYGTK